MSFTDLEKTILRRLKNRSAGNPGDVLSINADKGEIALTTIKLCRRKLLLIGINGEYLTGDGHREAEKLLPH